MVSNLHVLVAVYGGIVSYVCDNALNYPMLMAFNKSPTRDHYLMVAFIASY